MEEEEARDRLWDKYDANLRHAEAQPGRDLHKACIRAHVELPL